MTLFTEHSEDKNEYPQGKSEAAPDAVSRAFGLENRTRLLARYFGASEAVTPQNAWQHIYRLLLWIDRTTGLAHCYESDKAQPGRAWYPRTLAFHAWVSEALGTTPAHLGENIDWLFREAVKDLAGKTLTSRADIYAQQRLPFEGRGLPEPGEDPELVGIVRDVLGSYLSSEPSEEDLRTLTRRISLYMSQENKRRNLVGEGFEDVLAAIVRHLSSLRRLEVRNRSLLHELPGFHAPPASEKAKRVDLALTGDGHRILVSAKWSVRADCEEQFRSDFEAYARLEASGQNFDYTLITHEFGAARLRAACESRRQNALLFTHVVHINPVAVLAAYGTSDRGSANALRTHIESGRLLSLQAWLELLSR